MNDKYFRSQLAKLESLRSSCKKLGRIYQVVEAQELESKIAAEIGDQNVLKDDLNFTMDDMPLLHWCAERDFSRVLAALIKKGCDLTLLYESRTFMYYGIMNCNRYDYEKHSFSNLVPHISNPKITSDLLNLKDRYGKALLHYAVELKCHSAVKKLITNGVVRLDIQDNRGMTPLHHAVVEATQGIDDNNDMVLLLLSKMSKCAISIRDDLGMSALDYCVHKGRAVIFYTEMFKMLIDHADAYDIISKKTYGRSILNVAQQVGGGVLKIVEERLSQFRE